MIGLPTGKVLAGAVCCRMSDLESGPVGEQEIGEAKKNHRTHSKQKE